MKKINPDQLIAILGKEKADSFFLSVDWIKRQKDYSGKISDVRYAAYEQFANLIYLGNDEYEGNLYFTDANPNVLKFLPKIKKLVGKLWCKSSGLTSLEGSPTIVTRDFMCSRNELNDLNGAPEFVGGVFDCRYNNLKTLDGIPKEIKKNFYSDFENLVQRTPDGKTYKLVEK